VPLSLNSRGLTSAGMPTAFGSLDINFDFISHNIYFFASNGKTISFSLKDLSVADFYKEVVHALEELNVVVKINPMSVEMKTAVKMDTDNENKTYDADAVRRWWHLLVMIGNVFNKFRSRFSGKESPVNFFWGSFDLAITFFSGKIVRPPPDSDMIYRVAMDAEQITLGFWSGNDDSPEPIFFGYIYPKPDGFEKTTVKPSTGKWSAEKGEFILPYEAIRTSDPEGSLMEFCESIYEAGAELGHWDLKTLEHKQK
ncbi:MAG: DUF5996 family protein, partial [Bacteroidota bacterium]|nr:DUF5996 family protein [Bacteroidota bacterium]